MMKKIFSVAVLMCLCAVVATAQTKEVKDTASAPKDTVTEPYLLYPTLPAFNILDMDSSTIFNTYNIPEGNPIVIFFFSPDCGHCQRTMKRITRSMDSLEGVNFYLATPQHSFTEIRQFYKDHHLNKYKNIKIVGRDYEFFFGTFYGIKVVPDLAIYDAHKKLVKLIQGESNAKEIYEALHPAKK